MIKVNGHRKKIGSLLIPLNILIELFGISKLCMSQLQKQINSILDERNFDCALYPTILSDYH